MLVRQWEGFILVGAHCLLMAARHYLSQTFCVTVFQCLSVSALLLGGPCSCWRAFEHFLL